MPKAVRMPGAAPDLRLAAVTAQVDTLEVDHMVGRVMNRLQGISLERFLMEQAHPHFEDAIVNRFAYQGDRQVGHWPDLSEATRNIRNEMGFDPDWPINVRTNELFSTVANEADFEFGNHEAEMNLPGKAVQGVVAEKLETAQLGRGHNTMNPNFGPTPARPVLAADEGDLEALLERLTRWVIWEVAEML